jgi:integrase
MACIRKRRGKFVVDYRDALGVRRWQSCDTRREAEALLQRVLVEARAPRRSDADVDISVDDYARRWLATIQATVKARTLESYESSLRLHVLPILGAFKVRMLTRAHVKQFVARKLSGGYSVNSVRIMAATLHAMLNEAVEDEIILANPAARRGRSKVLKLAPAAASREEQIKAFERDQLAALLVAVAEREPRHYPMFLTMARTGLRLGEAFGLQWRDVDLERREVRVARSVSSGRIDTPKSGKARTVDLSQQVCDVLERHRDAQQAAALAAGRAVPVWVFPSLEGTPLDRANVEKAFKRALRHAGLPSH